MGAHSIVTTRFFENTSITVIMLNSLVMMAEDPTDEDPPEIFMFLDRAFLVLYSVEMVLKIVGYGFIFGEGSYLRDAWNNLDFIIVMTGYLTLASEL